MFKAKIYEGRGGGFFTKWLFIAKQIMSQNFKEI